MQLFHLVVIGDTIKYTLMDMMQVLYTKQKYLTINKKKL
ncbi:hypothetical protein [Klebsiella phage 05F01]|nr:hypothetical protein [Klebsiella phage 05F01]